MFETHLNVQVIGTAGWKEMPCYYWYGQAQPSAFSALHRLVLHRKGFMAAFGEFNMSADWPSLFFHASYYHFPDRLLRTVPRT